MSSLFAKATGGILAIAALYLLFQEMRAPEVPADGKIHIEYWMITGFKEAYPYYQQRFNEMQDRISVKAVLLPWQEHEKKILTAVCSGHPPDLVNQMAPVAKWAARMALVPLDEFIRRDRFDTTMFFPALWEEMRYNGRIYALPVYSGSYALFYNKALFRKAGLDPDRPPRSWDEVSAFTERLTVRDQRGRITQIGFIPNYGNLPISVLIPWQLGATFVSRDGRTVLLEDSAVVAGLRAVEAYYHTYPLDQIAAFLGTLGIGEQHGFINDKVAMMILDSSFPDQIKQLRPTMEYGVAMIPSFEGHPTASQSGSWWIAIPRGAKNPEAAWQLMKYVCDKEAQLEEIEHTEESLFPANRYAAYDPRFLNSPERQVFVSQMEFGHSPSIVPLAHEVFWREFFGAQERVIHGLQSPEAALAQAQHSVQAILDVAIDYDAYVRTHMEGM
jgi:multiple sugar transport system substrate-binding protein